MSLPSVASIGNLRYLLEGAQTAVLQTKNLKLTDWSTPALRVAASEALRRLQDQVRWKPGKDTQHLAKRKALGHLPAIASVETYNALAHLLLTNPGMVYRYHFRGVDYFAARGHIHDLEWLVIFDRSGLVETAFPPDDMDRYLTERGFQYLATRKELLLP